MFLSGATVALLMVAFPAPRYEHSELKAPQALLATWRVRAGFWSRCGRILKSIRSLETRGELML
jgi:hypothetical protein